MNLITKTTKQLAIWQSIILFFGFLATSYAQTPFSNIIYPFRADPVIVQSGKNFHILYNNSGGHSIDSVTLKAEYWNVKLTLDSVQKGHFEYDMFTRQSTNNKIWVSVPANAPEEMYDLMVYAAGETFIAKRAVKVVKTFSDKHTFIHISDTHVSRNWVGTANNGYAKELELLDRFISVANIICPDFVVVTGDLIMNYTRFDADENGWGGTEVSSATAKPGVVEKYQSYFEGAKGFRGVQAIDAPVFSTTGNHDFYGVKEDDYMAKSLQWNNYCGKRVFTFSYAGTRMLLSDNYLGDPVVDIPANATMSGYQGQLFEHFLKTNGEGKLIIMAQHNHTRFDTAFLNKHHIRLVLNGHNHAPLVKKIGTIPTLSIRPGVVCRSGEIKRWEEVLGFFRIFRVDGSDFKYSEPLRFCSNPADDYTKLDLNLTLNYKKNNTGRSTANEATIKNKLPVNLPKCHVRFVMKKGTYKIEGGQLYQTVNTGALTILDVKADVDACSTKTVKAIAVM